MLNDRTMLNRYRNLRLLLAVLFLSSLLVACGQSGELRHPDAPETEQPASK